MAVGGIGSNSEDGMTDVELTFHEGLRTPDLIVRNARNQRLSTIVGKLQTLVSQFGVSSTPTPTGPGSCQCGTRDRTPVPDRA